MKLALVTAGMRRVGAAIAARLAQDGWTLALHSHHPASPEGDLAAIITATGAKWANFQADLADPSAPADLVRRVTAHFGQAPGLLVNNASRFVYDDWQSVDGAGLADRMAVNLNAPVLLATALAQQLGSVGKASIVNILDQRIRQPNGDQLSYTLSKQALAGATETLARALAPNIRVNGVAPGLTMPTDDYRPAQMVALAQAMPLKILPEPEDVADAVVWLANARATTGQIICVDGGAAMKSFDRDFVFMA